MKATIQRNNFTAGEIHPDFAARSDLSQYMAAARELLNVIPMVEGGVKKRGGTWVLANLGAGNVCRLLAMRHINQMGLVIVLTPFRLRVFFPGVSIPLFDVATSWGTEMIRTLSSVQISNGLIFADGHYAPKWLRMSDDGSTWSFETFPIDVLPVDEVVQSPDYALTPSGKDLGADITLTLDSPGVFTAGDVAGRYVSINGGLVRVTGWDAGTPAVLTGRVVKALTSTVKAISRSWEIREPVWSDTLGWPSVIQIYKQRLVLASTSKRPDVIWFSRVGDYHNFLQTTNDADAFEVVPANEVPQRVVAMGGVRGLTVLTWNGEFLITGGQDGLSPTTVQMEQQSQYGSVQDVPPVMVGHDLAYVQRGGTRVRGMRYDYQSDSMVSPDLSVMVQHIPETHGVICGMAYHQEPDGLLWLVMQDGTVVSVTLNRDQQVNAWARHQFNGQVLSVTVPGGYLDSMLLAVCRSGNLYLETYSPSATQDSLPDTPVLYECAVGLFPPEISSAPGTAMASRAKIDRLTLALRQASGVFVNGVSLPLPTQSFTGRYDLTMAGWSDLYAQPMRITQKGDAPFRLLTAIYSMSANEK